MIKLSHSPVNESINDKSDVIKVKGHIGTWYVVDRSWHNSIEVFELESEQHGDEAPHIIVDKKGNIVMEDVWNGFSDLREAVNDVDETSAKMIELEIELEDADIEIFAVNYDKRYIIVSGKDLEDASKILNSKQYNRNLNITDKDYITIKSRA